MSGSNCAIRGTFFDFIDDPWKHVGQEQRAARFFADGLLVVRDGIIADFGPFAEVAPRRDGPHRDKPDTQACSGSTATGRV